MRLRFTEDNADLAIGLGCMRRLQLVRTLQRVLFFLDVLIGCELCPCGRVKLSTRICTHAQVCPCECTSIDAHTTNAHTHKYSNQKQANKHTQINTHGIFFFTHAGIPRSISTQNRQLCYVTDATLGDEKTVNFQRVKKNIDFYLFFFLIHFSLLLYSGSKGMHDKGHAIPAVVWSQQDIS